MIIPLQKAPPSLEPSAVPTIPQYPAPFFPDDFEDIVRSSSYGAYCIFKLKYS